MRSGYAALREDAATIDLTGRGEIFVSGEDCARLLHAISSNHIERLTPGTGCYAFFLNAQGKILADANIFRLEGRFLVDTEPETRASLFRHIDRYIIAEDVALEDASDALAVIGVEGPRAADAVAGLGAPLPDVEEYANSIWDDVIVARASFTGAPGIRLFVPRARKDEILGKLNLAPASGDEARIVRLEHGRPRYGDDITDSTLPQESAQMHAVSFNKGCYLGQEIVERIRARGQVHRKLEKLEYAPGLPPAGVQITSEAFSPAAGKMVGVGYVRRP
jgi:folate-binding protein YgfZ